MYKVIKTYKTRDGRKCDLELFRGSYYFKFGENDRHIIDCDFCEKVLNGVDDTVINYDSKEVMIDVVITLYVDMC